MHYNILKIIKIYFFKAAKTQAMIKKPIPVIMGGSITFGAWKPPM